ncbi:hypothetical protein CR513_14692, partial [Mucuna pruriens]
MDQSVGVMGLGQMTSRYTTPQASGRRVEACFVLSYADRLCVLLIGQLPRCSRSSRFGGVSIFMPFLNFRFLTLSLTLPFRHFQWPNEEGALSAGRLVLPTRAAPLRKGDETQHSAISATKEEFPFKILFQEAEESDLKALFSWIDPGVSRVYSVYTSPDSLVGMVDVIYHRSPCLVEVLPCRSDEIFCKWVAESEESFFYFYETLFSKLGIKLPFTDFERAVLQALNIAPTQFHPNN